jgi:cell wall integrity and stress response component
MSDGKCHDTCNSGNYAFGVVQNQSCWCSNIAPGVTASLGQCNFPCPGFPSEFCGQPKSDLFGYIALDNAPKGTAGAANTPTVSSSAPQVEFSTIVVQVTSFVVQSVMSTVEPLTTLLFSPTSSLTSAIQALQSSTPPRLSTSSPPPPPPPPPVTVRVTESVAATIQFAFVGSIHKTHLMHFLHNYNYFQRYASRV